MSTRASAPGLDIASATCPVHPELAATGLCERCGRFFCAGCRARVVAEICVECIAKMMQTGRAIGGLLVLPLIGLLLQPVSLLFSVSGAVDSAGAVSSPFDLLADPPWMIWWSYDVLGGVALTALAAQLMRVFYAASIGFAVSYPVLGAVLGPRFETDLARNVRELSGARVRFKFSNCPQSLKR